MAKTVFRFNELKSSNDKVMLGLNRDFSDSKKDEDVVETVEFEGPTADDLRREAEEFKKQWEVEKKALLDETENQANQIIKNAEDAAFAEVKSKTDEAAVIKQDAQLEAEKIIAKANEDAQNIISQAEEQAQAKVQESYNQGFEKGCADGFEKGNDEVNRLIDMAHGIIDASIKRRSEILEETEQQIVDLVVLMTRKVVKVISENQKTVVMNNVLQALRKVKGRSDVTLHVNMEEVKLTAAHTQDFIRAVENVKNIKVIEDSSVEKGGCIVETDFGSIDARISSQLAELEQKILEISPMKTKAKSSDSVEI